MTNTPTLGQRFFAELLGTAVLVFVGAGTVTAMGTLPGKSAPTLADLGVVALAFAIAISTMIYAIGHISGGHINPAVSIALAVNKRISWKEAGVYVVAQVLGGLVGALIIALAYGAVAAKSPGYGVNDFNEGTVGYIVATLVEAIGTFMLLFVIAGTALDRRAPSGWAGLMIGLTVAGEIMVFGVVSSASLNPARSIGPAVIQLLFGGQYNLPHLLPYIVGPIVGGILGVLTYDFIAHPRAVAKSKAVK